MTGKTHRIIGIASGLTYLIAMAEPEYAPATLGAVLAGSYFGSLLPDLDQPAADIWDSLPLGHVAGKVVDPFFKHRNISHSVLGLAIFFVVLSLVLRIFPAYWGINTSFVLIATTISYTSHLIADMITVEGIPLIYPLKRMFGIPPRPFEGIRIETGKWFENLVAFPLVNIWLISIIFFGWDKIKLILFK